jgi:hypothetical protein
MNTIFSKWYIPPTERGAVILYKLNAFTKICLNTKYHETGRKELVFDYANLGGAKDSPIQAKPFYLGMEH